MPQDAVLIPSYVCFPLWFFLSFEWSAWLTMGKQMFIEWNKRGSLFSKSRAGRALFLLLLLLNLRGIIYLHVYILCLSASGSIGWVLCLNPQPFSLVPGCASGSTETPTQTPVPGWCTCTPAVGMLGTYSSQLSLANWEPSVPPSDGCILV